MSSTHNLASYIEDACPYEESKRATRCEGCCALNAVTPCVAAFLRGAKPARTRKLPAAPFVEFEHRKAA